MVHCRAVFRKDADGVLTTLATTQGHTATTVYHVQLNFCGGVVASGTTKTVSAQLAQLALSRAVVQDVAHGTEVLAAIAETMAQVGAISRRQIVRSAPEISSANRHRSAARWKQVKNGDESWAR